MASRLLTVGKQADRSRVVLALRDSLNILLKYVLYAGEKCGVLTYCRNSVDKRTLIENYDLLVCFLRVD
jgi:hypothetical protein